MDREKTFWARGGWWVVTQMVLLVAAVLLPLIIPGPRLPVPADLGVWLRGVGIIVMAVGCILLVAGTLALRGNLTPLPAPREGAELVTTGVYALVRHPLYGGMALVGIGAAVADPTLTRLACAATLFLFFDRKAAVEERFLMEAFSPEVYGAYRKRTARLIPGLY